MTSRMTPFTRRLLAVALLIVLAALPYWLLVRPIADAFAANRAQLDEQSGLLQRYRALATDVDSLSATLESVKSDGIGSDFYLVGDSEALVAAELQNRLKTIVAASGGRLASSQVLQASEEGGFRQVTIRARITMDIGGLSRTLYALETERPILFVDNLDISARNQRSRSAEAEGDQELTVSIDVYGFMKPSG